MVATAAWVAAEAAKAAIGASQGSAPDRKKELYKLIPNLRCLLQETENKKWCNGEIGTGVLKQYLTVSDNKFEDDIGYVERNSATEVDIDVLED